MFDFRHLSNGTDFDIVHLHNGLVVFRRSVGSGFAAALDELSLSLRLAGFDVTLGSGCEWMRVEKGKIDLADLSTEIARQISLLEYQAKRMTVTNDYMEPKAECQG